MAELILKFKDETGARREVSVAANRFTVGRSPDNDLQIASNALSRKHIQIERFGDVFVVTDAGSSNGTTLNGTELTQPVALKDGDTLLLGSAIEMAVVIEGLNYVSGDYTTAKAGNFSNASSQDESASFFQSIFFIAPVFGVVILVLLGVLVFVLRDGREPQIAQVNREEIEENRRPPRNRNDDIDNEEEPEDTPPVNRPNVNGNSNSTPSNTNSTPAPSSDEEKVEKFALQFLRSITGDTNAVLTSRQVALVNSKIKTLKNSTAFRENLKAAGRGNANFEKIGQEHGFKANFVAAAALAKLGNSRGEPTATANSITPGIRKYANVIGLELANDGLLVVAAYAEGEEPNAMRDRIANLANKTKNASAATVRTIWFLSENGKLKPASFDFALNFLAAGTVMQDTKAFGF